MNGKIFLIAGNNARVGKSEFARALERSITEYTEFHTLHINFGDYVKQQVAIDKNIDITEMYNDKLKEKHRADMVRVGDGGRKLNPHKWSNMFIADYLTYKEKYEKIAVICQDVRYYTEVINLRDNHKFEIVKVYIYLDEKIMLQRMNYDYVKWAKWLELGKSDSQRELSINLFEPDYLFANNKDIQHLSDYAFTVMKAELQGV